MTDTAKIDGTGTNAAKDSRTPAMGCTFMALGLVGVCALATAWFAPGPAAGPRLPPCLADGTHATVTAVTPITPADGDPAGLVAAVTMRLADGSSRTCLGAGHAAALHPGDPIDGHGLHER